MKESLSIYLFFLYQNILKKKQRQDLLPLTILKKILLKQQKFLSELPFHLKLNYKTGNRHWNIQLVHSSLESNDTYLYESENDEVFTNMLEDSKADLIVMGHTHLSFTKQFENKKWAVNCGSVGRSKETNRLASYVILTLDDEKDHS
jgi:UDP-2,3-diacylglucosamine pyrophosphatase LpxH